VPVEQYRQGERGGDGGPHQHAPGRRAPRIAHRPRAREQRDQRRRPHRESPFVVLDCPCRVGERRGADAHVCGPAPEDRLQRHLGRIEQVGEAGQRIVRARELREEREGGRQALRAQAERQRARCRQDDPGAPAVAVALPVQREDHRQREQGRRDAVHHARVEHVGEDQAAGEDRRRDRRGRERRPREQRRERERMEGEVPDDHPHAVESAEEEQRRRAGRRRRRQAEAPPGEQPGAPGADRGEGGEGEAHRRNRTGDEGRPLRHGVVGDVQIGKVGNAAALPRAEPRYGEGAVLQEPVAAGDEVGDVQRVVVAPAGAARGQEAKVEQQVSGVSCGDRRHAGPCFPAIRSVSGGFRHAMFVRWPVYLSCVPS
jgi:hypothetical protein